MKDSTKLTIVNIAKDVLIAGIHANNEDISKKSVVEIATPIHTWMSSLEKDEKSK